MLLAIDVGNTNVTVGAFEGGQLINLWRLGTDAKKTSDEYGVALSAVVNQGKAIAKGQNRVDAAIYGSVVPALNPVIESAVSTYFGIRAEAVTVKSPLGIKLKVDQPSEVGVDRLLNALAVAELHGKPAVVIDFGTATTFDCVSSRGDYLGGAILIGPKLAALALHEYTAQLPRVDVRPSKRIVGRNTVECIQSGLYFGYLGMIERVLRESLAEMGPAARKAKVVATGGLAGVFYKDLLKIKAGIEHAPDLTLQGLRIAHAKLAPAGAAA